MDRQQAILSIGEDPDSSRLLKKLLSRSGFEVWSADSAHSALAAVAARPPDLIFADLDMPLVMEICRLIKGRHRRRDVPVIAVTSCINNPHLPQALLTGASDFVCKPVQPEELRMRVNARIEISRLGMGPQKRSSQCITESRNEEGVPGDSELCFRDMANSVPGMIVASGPDGRPTFFNTGWLEFRGRSIDQELGWGWMEGLHPDDRDELQANYDRILEARHKWQLEYRLRRADGEYRWIFCSGVPRYGAGGAFIGYMACCVDVTDIRHIEAERLKLAQADRLTLFAVGVAHDFNNLLGAAFAELDIAVPTLACRAPARQHLRNLESILKRASEIVELLISYSSTGNTPALEAVDLSALLQDVSDMMQGVLSRKAVRLTREPAANLPPIPANAPQIRRVVMNLITNAVEALGSKAGSITVSTSSLHIEGDEAVMEPTGLKHGDYVVLSVADTGCGMTEETLSRALDPFFTTKDSGHGLGLAVVQAIVRSHGGVVRVSSATGQGTTVEVFLPCAHGTNSKENAVRKAVGTDISFRGHTNILIVEDERMLRSATGIWLEDHGFRILCAADGEEAVQRLADPTLHIDVVILDLTLPDMPGIEVLAQIERLRPGATVILTSGRDVDANNLGDIVSNGRRVFLRKPYRLSELVQTLLKRPAVVPGPLLRVADAGGPPNL